MSVRFCKKMFVIFTRVPIGKADEMVYCKGHTRYLSALGF